MKYRKGMQEIVEVEPVAKKLSWKGKVDPASWRHRYRVTQDEECIVSAKQGAEEEGDEIQDFPHSLELGDECDNNKNLAVEKK